MSLRISILLLFMLRSIFSFMHTFAINNHHSSIQKLSALSSNQFEYQDSNSNALTPRVIFKSQLPRVYVYDHCPFCVRVRLALGLKNIKHELYFLANDDIDTPTNLVGKKVAPIFEVPGILKPMPESLDIIKLIDSDPMYGPINFFKPMSTRTDIAAWQKKVAEMNRILIRPRYMLAYLPEFAQQDGKNAFVKNHPLEPYTKEDWKKNLTDKERWGLYKEAYDKSFSLIEEANQSLLELEGLIYSTDYCTEGGLSIDDIDLWSRLRSMTLVKGIKFPAKLDSYMKTIAIRADLPLYDSLAC